MVGHSAKTATRFVLCGASPVAGLPLTGEWSTMAAPALKARRWRGERPPDRGGHGKGMWMEMRPRLSLYGPAQDGTAFAIGHPSAGELQVAILLIKIRKKIGGEAA
jgi:hypothetical protein